MAYMLQNDFGRGWGNLEAVSGGLGGYSCVSWVDFRPCWGHLGAPTGRCLGVSWGHFGPCRAGRGGRVMRGRAGRESNAVGSIWGALLEHLLPVFGYKTTVVLWC